jgi:putative sterol carrier protein
MATLESLTATIRTRAAVAPRLGYRVKFALNEGGVILWDGTASPATVVNDDGAADTTLKLSLDSLEKMVAGGLDPTFAYMTGKLKVDGSLGVAMKLAAMLGD